MTAVEPTEQTVYLVGLPLDEERLIGADFRVHPDPGWNAARLADQADPGPDLFAGRAVLVMECSGTDLGPAGALWRARLLACGCPWVAVGDARGGAARTRCLAAGAAAYLPRPFTPAALREVVRQRAAPRADGRDDIHPVTVAALLRWLAALQADLLLKVVAPAGRIGLLAIRRGRPVHARVLDGPDGEVGLAEVIGWEQGRVYAETLPDGLPANLTAPAAGWAPAAVAAAETACDRVLEDLPEAAVCVADLSVGQIIVAPGPEPTGAINDATVAAVAELLLPAARAGGGQAEELLVRGREGWVAAAWLGPGPLALVLAAAGAAHLGLVRVAFAAAAAEFDRAIRGEARSPVAG